MDGERSIPFCKLLSQNTAKLKPNEIPHMETWPFLITLLMKCISLEITSSKRRLPKLTFAKTLRTVIQRAEDAKFSRRMLLLISVVKPLLNHIWEVVKDVPCFQSEYGIILRHLLEVKEYCFLIKKRVYCNLVLWYMNKVEVAMGGKSNIPSNTKEEIFRSVLTLHSLLENPPGDFPDNLRDDLINGFSVIFSSMREEGKISRKLVECVNVFLLRDGPNLGNKSIEIHLAMQGFIFHFWLLTLDRCLKNALILYARIQLKLCRSHADENPLLDQLVDIVGKELDQGNVVATSMPRGDAARDDKTGALATVRRDLIELAASVFYQASVNTTKELLLEKRLRREHAASRMKDGLARGKSLWIGAFCVIIRNYHSRMNMALLLYWFEGVCENFERILNDANRLHAYDGLLWMLRSLQELSFVMPHLALRKESLQCSSYEVRGAWHLVWSCLMHALPIFSNVTSIADAALVLLGNIISNDLANVPDVPQEVWDLWIFKHKPSVCALYFIACYFSRKGCQGDLREVLHLRQSVLKAVLGFGKEPSFLNERVVMLLPEAIFSLCSGSVSIQQRSRELSMLDLYMDIQETTDTWLKTEEDCRRLGNELFDCSLECISQIQPDSGIEVLQMKSQCNLRLPQKIRHPLFREVEDYFLTTIISNKEIERMHLSDIFLSCAFICNYVYGSMLIRLREEKSALLSQMLQCLLELLVHAVAVIQKNQHKLQTSGASDLDLISDVTPSNLASLRLFLCCSLFGILRETDVGYTELYERIVQVIERLLLALAALYEEFSACTWSFETELLVPELSQSSLMTPQDSAAVSGDKLRIVDMDLDDDSKDTDMHAVGSKSSYAMSFSSLHWKLDMISTISSFFSVLPASTWDRMFNLLEKENDPEVYDNILRCLCQKFSCCKGNISNLVKSLNNSMEMNESYKLSCIDCLPAICDLLHSLLPLFSVGKLEHVNESARQKASEQNLASLGELVNKIADSNLLDWSARVKLIDCICCFVTVDPRIAQVMIERLFAMLQDADYRVRLSLARRIGVLFQTWDGHYELFQDISSNFGVKLVMASQGKLVTSKEVLAAGVQSGPMTETAIITLAHIAFVSEKVEVEACFIICAVAGIDPCQRELVFATLDNISSKLQYATRSKYLEEFVRSILFSWVACGVSIASLVEIRELFISKSEPKSFMQYCCPWLLPALILNGNMADLSWASTVASQPLPVLVKLHFVHVFSISMALHCSNESNKDRGTTVLRSSILHIAEISEHERDNTIKKNLLSIVSCLFSLSSSSADPTVPYFRMETIVLAIRMVVDGFLDIKDHTLTVSVVDKVQIFRPDRVFKYLVGIHYEISSAVNPGHRCHRLSAIQVLINVLGDRVAVPSTSSYLFNLVGQFIGCESLQEQCCLILSTLLDVFNYNPTKNVINVLGEQLQFLVPKLVSCCIPPKGSPDLCVSQSSRIMSILHRITVDADSSLHDFVKELEPFPELECFARIRKFHLELCMVYSSKEHFLKLVHRSCCLPSRLLFLSLQTLHKKLLMGEIVKPECKEQDVLTKMDGWLCEPDVVSTLWTLIGNCNSDDSLEIRALLADFLSRVGIGDPHQVVFHLPADCKENLLLQPKLNGDVSNFWDMDISDECLVKLLRMLKKYLLDDSVKIVDITLCALTGILSTERGQGALIGFDSYDRSVIAIHSKGVNMDVVEKLLLNIEKNSNAQARSLEDSFLWKTHGKTYDAWICNLMYSLINHTNDTILRLCRDVAVVKAEVAEYLFPIVLVNLAARTDQVSELCEIISAQVQEHIFTESNKLTKSVQVMLNALNKLRLCNANQILGMSFSPSKRETSKHSKPSSSNSRTRYSLTSEKSKDSSIAAKGVALSNSIWKKVYWLSIEYLVVAKAAIYCGSYFTAVMYVEHWCEEHFNCLTLGKPDFSQFEKLPPHIELLVAAITQINEPDSIYGIIQSHKLASQIITYEHEGNWSKALECYDLLVRTSPAQKMDGLPGCLLINDHQHVQHSEFSKSEAYMCNWKSYKGLMRSLQRTGCTHVLDLYCQGLMSQKGLLVHDPEFMEMQYEAAWRAGNWDFSLLSVDVDSSLKSLTARTHFNENLHCCLRALLEGDSTEFHVKLEDSKQELVLAISQASKESTEIIHSAIIKLQILDHLGVAWDIRWKQSLHEGVKSHLKSQNSFPQPVIPMMAELESLNFHWRIILKQTELNLNLLEPFMAFRRVLLQILNCQDCFIEHLLQSASALRKGSRFSLAAAALQELNFLTCDAESQLRSPYLCSLGRLEEAKLLRAQGQREMAINLARYILDHYQLDEDASNAYRLVGKWLAETRSTNSRTILEQYLKRAVDITTEKSIKRQCQAYFHLAHYTDALFRSYEERLASSEWQAAMRLRKHKTRELEALIKRLRSSTKGEKTDYSAKIQELQKQLAMDREEADKLEIDRDNFLTLALEGYQRCLVVGDKYDVRVVFRLVSLWFNLCLRKNVVNGMLSAVKEVQSYKFVPLMYQIASRMGSSKEGQGSANFQVALVSLVKKMAIDHPYHTIFQLLALANGDRVKDKQRSRNSFIVDMDKKLAAENLLDELSSYHGAIVKQMKQLVEIYIKLAELEIKREASNKRIMLPREIRSLRELELVPVVTATFPIDKSCQYPEGSFPHFKGLVDSVTIMNGINAPKVVVCMGSDGQLYRQLAKSGNDDLRQDAVMEQFFGLVNTFLQNNRDAWKRRLRIRTYKVVPFTPSAGVLEWVDRTMPLGDYLLGSSKNGGAHARYGVGDWTFLHCREYMCKETEKRKAFLEVCKNFRSVLHYFFLEKYAEPANWFEKRLSYTRSVAASSMVGYIVGLGDRHSMNILIDEATAEVVHIDLGVAFEQGLMLKTPERVPFRLTRDIIDGMGVTGVEGVFRRCCEETLSVIRTNKEALLTIIEVFIHDPLYKWALSPLKALQRQKETDDDIESSLDGSQDVYEGNKDAARALLRVKQKLDGYEDGEMRSVQGQVQQLIQDAIDTDRLCQMFPGWGAWL